LLGKGLQVCPLSRAEAEHVLQQACAASHLLQRKFMTKTFKPRITRPRGL